jgi:hypothetical protein
LTLDQLDRSTISQRHVIGNIYRDLYSADQASLYRVEPTLILALWRNTQNCASTALNSRAYERAGRQFQLFLHQPGAPAEVSDLFG